MCTIHSQCIPSKYAGSDPEAFWLRPLKAITASVQPESARVVYYAISDSPHPFQFRFSKEGLDYIVQNRPGSDLVVLVGLVREQAGVQAGISGPGFWQKATSPQPARNQFPTFRIGSVLPQTSWIILCKTSLGPI